MRSSSSRSTPATQRDGGALGQLGARRLQPEQALATINRMVDQQAYTLAANDLFFLSSALFLLLLVFVWMTRPAQGAAADAGGAH